ncbi:MAG: hypothetical protein ABSE99_16460 [Terracidiphilus sp.]|jgi:hypothetical protein
MSLFKSRHLFSKGRHFFIGAGLIALLCIASSSAFGQFTSTSNGTSSFNATLPESLTVSTTATTLTFNLTPQTTTASTSIPITTSWVVNSTRANVELDGYWSSATAALTDGASHNIPTSVITGTVTTTESGAPSANSPFTTTLAHEGGAPASAGLALFVEPITSSNYEGVDSSSIVVTIDLSSSTLYKTLPAATYTGTLTFAAFAL